MQRTAVTPIESYESSLTTAGYLRDDAQLAAVKQTQALFEQLLQAKPPASLWVKFFQRPQKLNGLYVFGGTGRGKTYLVDSFYSCLPFAEKHRIHFHHFMREIHEQLGRLPKSPDPLIVIGREYARKYRIICIDEFHVHDIGDAMIMAGLLNALFQNNIILVTTSNIPIDDLYKNGLQRDNFLHAIDLLHENMQPIDLGEGTDYRYHSIEKSGSYHILAGVGRDDFLDRRLKELAPCPPKHNRSLRINNREIDYVALADDIVWFDFDDLCNTPRSSSDYIEIAETFHTILLGNVPVMNENHEDIARRFIHLIDALYDHRVNLIVTAQAVAEKLYAGRTHRESFNRTVSRLIEMDSKEYYSSPHVASGAAD